MRVTWPALIGWSWTTWRDPMPTVHHKEGQGQHLHDVTKDLTFKILLSLMTAVGGYVASTLGKLNDSVSLLNQRMAVVVTTVAEQKQEINDVKYRIRELELEEVSHPATVKPR